MAEDSQFYPNLYDRDLERLCHADIFCSADFQLSTAQAHTCVSAIFLKDNIGIYEGFERLIIKNNIIALLYGDLNKKTWIYNTSQL